MLSIQAFGRRVIAGLECHTCISSWVKVPQNQRQSLNMAESVDWDLKHHLKNVCVCVKLTSFFLF